MKLEIRKTVLAMIADAGAVVAACTAVFALVVAGLEFFKPGIAATAVAPQAIAVVAALSLAAALLSEEPTKRSWFGKAGYLLIAAGVTGLAIWASWYYFSSVPEVQGWLTAGIGIAVGGLLFASAKPIPDGL